MLSTSPGQTTTITTSDIPSGEDVGYQVQKAVSGTVAVARQTLGVTERPAGSGNYVVVFVAPTESDLYLIVLDWSDGVLTPETSKVLELQVTGAPQVGISDLGAVADYTKMRLGGETWNGLYQDPNYGPDFIQRAITVVERRTLTNPPASTADEQTLDPVVLDYLGILAALELITAARDFWASQAYSYTKGNDSSETVTYANRAALVNELRDDLMRALPIAQVAAAPIIDAPVPVAVAMPAIDEDCDRKVTEDPRDFPSERRFPGYGGRAIDGTGFLPWWER